MPGRRRSYVHLFQAEITALMEANRLTLSDMRVLFFMIGQCQWGNWCTQSGREIGRRLGMKPADVSRCLGRLVDEGVVLRHPPLEGRTWVYQLPTLLIQHGPLEDLTWKRPRDRQRQDAQRHAGKRNASLPRKGRSASSRVSS